MLSLDEHVGFGILLLKIAFCMHKTSPLQTFKCVCVREETCAHLM